MSAVSMFKKLVGFLFEEEEEVEEEGELEDISFHSDYKESDVFQEEPPVITRRREPKEHIRVEPVHSVPSRIQKPVVEEKKESHFTTIDLEEEKKPPRRTQSASLRRTPTVMRSEPTKKEFEFVPVISPMFGADETTSSTTVKSRTENHMNDRKTISKVPKKNPLGTVLSPMYGATELEEFEVEAKERLEAEAHEYQRYAEPKKEKMIVEYDDAADDEIVSVPLEDLLTNEEQQKSKDDLLQFSLFGNDEVVSSKQEKDSYTMKE